jgi:hypothetical protein
MRDLRSAIGKAGRDFTSCDVQGETCSAFAKARGYDLLVRIRDKGESEQASIAQGSSDYWSWCADD